MHAGILVENKDSPPTPSADHSGETTNSDTVEPSEAPALKKKVDGQGKHAGSARKGSSNAKGPSRPRRKKARRACFACQRAHLTCGMCFVQIG